MGTEVILCVWRTRGNLHIDFLLHDHEGKLSEEHCNGIICQSSLLCAQLDWRVIAGLIELDLVFGRGSIAATLKTHLLQIYEAALKGRMIRYDDVSADFIQREIMGMLFELAELTDMPIKNEFKNLVAFIQHKAQEEAARKKPKRKSRSA